MTSVRQISSYFLGLYAFLAVARPALAQEANTVSEVAANITGNVSDLPGLISAMAYLLGIVFGFIAVIKFRDHIDNPSNTQIRQPVIFLIAGGALFALPTILGAMASAISGSGDGGLGSQFGLGGAIGALNSIFGFVTGAAVTTGGGGGFNDVLDNIVTSIELVPGLISGVAYLLGLLLGYAAILKFKEHVESPEQVKLHEGLIRLLVGGALFALPTIYEAMFTLVTGNVGASGGVLSSFFNGGILYSEQAGAACQADKTTFGGAICRTVVSAALAPAFLSAISYLFGLILGVWALLKIRDHVLDPKQTPIWDGVSRIIAGGMFFALPYITQVMALTVAEEGTFVTNTAFNDTVGGSCDTPGGLDIALYCFMDDLLAPAEVIISFFALVAGIIFVMIGISRLMKSAQEGAKGPGGIGTLMTFLTGGILISFNSILGAISESFFASSTVMTFSQLTYVEGLQGAEIDHVNTVISAIIKFMIVVGLISFVRGWFIMRDVAEGNSQASAMSGTTHIIGGALAVNLGPLLNAVQQTLGIAGIGIEFGPG